MVQILLRKANRQRKKNMVGTPKNLSKDWTYLKFSLQTRLDFSPSSQVEGQKGDPVSLHTVHVVDNTSGSCAVDAQSTPTPNVQEMY
jgi:hypothetical protein